MKFLGARNTGISALSVLVATAMIVYPIPLSAFAQDRCAASGRCDNLSVADRGNCLAKLAGEADRLVAEKFMATAQYLQRAGQHSDRSGNPRNPSAVKQLNESQNYWRLYRQKACNVIGLTNPVDASAGVTNDCLCQKDYERLDELQSLIRD